MWMPIAQMVLDFSEIINLDDSCDFIGHSFQWTNYLSPENIRGLSPTTMLLAMIGNGLMIPRALFIRDLMW